MEQQLISHIRERVGTKENLFVGIGDDAAILNTQNANTVVTVDLVTDGVDFMTDQTPPFLIGRKALAVNLSDLAAMSAIPHSIVAAVVLPQTLPKISDKNAIQSSPQRVPQKAFAPMIFSPPTSVLELAKGIMDGMLALADEFHVSLAGGDVNTWNGPLAISITAIGTVSPFGSFLRSGAKPHDRILVTGRFGGSLFRRQFLFRPRIQESLFLNEHYKIHAAMDVSDGLLLDLTRLAKESHVGFILEDQKIPIHPDVFRNPAFPTPETLKESLNEDEFPTLCSPAVLESYFQSHSHSPLECAYGDGEDFELILAVPPDEAKRLLADQPFRTQNLELTEIGFFCPIQDGQMRKTAANELIPIVNPAGFLHHF